MPERNSDEQTDIPRPLPYHLADLHGKLKKWADEHDCDPPQPPIPLILAAYHFSSEDEKDRAWHAMQQWAKRNGCPHLLAGVTDAMADDPVIRKYGRYWRAR
jgi:hypothetical protein